MIKNNRVIIKLILILLVIISVLGVVGFTYSYFSLEVEGEPKDIVMNTGDLRLEYLDDTKLSLEKALPGDSITKKIIVKNVGTKLVSYNLVWANLINTIDNADLHIDFKCRSYKNYGESNQEEYDDCKDFYNSVPYTETKLNKVIRKDIEIDTKITQEYVITITFLNRPYSQNYNLNKSFNGTINIEEYVDSSPEAINCTFDGDMVQGTEYVNGQYTYRYKQKGDVSSNDSLGWSNVYRSEDGWGVQLTDKSSTEDVTSKVCTYINDKPVIYMTHMFDGSKTQSIDLSSFNTSNVINMYRMFSNVLVTELDLSKFNTKKVTDMGYMFSSTQVNTLDLSNFNTINVTNMTSMFINNKSLSIDVSSFDTSNVTGMSGMFWSANAPILDLSSFDTSKVTNMASMFNACTASTILGIEKFDTSNVTDMSFMFNETKVSNLDLRNFNTSKVTRMDFMFSNSIAEIIDVSSFDTSNVSNMQAMFSNVNAIINVDNFNTSKVTDMSKMFSNTKFEKLNLSNFDTSKVYDMAYMFNNSTIKEVEGLNNFDTSKVTNMSFMFESSDIEVLDLSSFDTSSVTKMDRMFAKSKATIGYAKDEETAAKFNDSSITYIPSTLKFTVK